MIIKIRSIKTRLFIPHEKLIPFLELYFKRVVEKDMLVVTSKIVALAEGRIIEHWNKKIKEKTIRSESEIMIPAKHICLTVKDGMVMASAGIDESNAAGCLILLPKDSWKIAEVIRRHFLKKFKLKKLGVIITDSRNAPFRSGVTGVAIAYSGFRGLKDYRKSLDIFGRPFHFSRVDVADSLATAAVLGMGEGNERRPLAIISGSDIEFVNKVDRRELRIDVADDMYGPLFQHVRKKSFNKDKRLN